ncbi:hypothetical protein [Rhizobium mongolense]
MTTLPAKNVILSQTIDDWPHRACVQSDINSMMDEGYSAKSIPSTIRTITAFKNWKTECPNGNPTRLTQRDIARFLECRAAASTLRHGERRSLQRLRAKLVEAGTMRLPPKTLHPIDDVTSRFAIELRRRGYAAPTISAHLRYSKQFLRASWNDGSGKVRSDPVTAFDPWRRRKTWSPFIIFRAIASRYGRRTYTAAFEIGPRIAPWHKWRHPR